MDELREAFDQIHADEALKASTLRSLQARRTPRVRLHPLPLVTACAALALALLGTGYWMLGVPVAYVSVDVNPSVELSLNRMDRVLHTIPYNDDGAAVLDGLKLQGLPCLDALDVLLEDDTLQSYLTGTSALTFTVASEDPDRQAALLAAINGSDVCQRHRAHCTGADMDTLQQAHHCGMSFGKYAAWQLLRDCGSTLTAEQCEQMTMAELRDLLAAYNQTAPLNTPVPSPGNGHHGGGHHGGHD